MRLSDEQRAVVAIEENSFISACPGAGKTRVATAKVQREIGDAVRSGREIVCLTFTNASCDEITSRLQRSLSSAWLAAVRVRTLHSFLLETVLRPWRFRSRTLARGFRLAVPGSPLHEKAIQDVLADSAINENDLRRAVGKYWRDVDGTVRVENEEPIPVERFVQVLEGSGAIDYPGVVYHAYRLLCDDVVARALRCAISWLIVDEYQDFNPIALALFSRFAEGNRTKMFFIGDLGQMIYSFSGVTIDTLRQTANRICTRHESLGETYRCGTQISRAATNLGLGELRPTGWALTLADRASATRGRTVETLRLFMDEVRGRGLHPRDVGVLAPQKTQAAAAAQALVSLGENAVFFTGWGKSGNGWLVDLVAALLVGCRDFDVEAVRLLRSKLYEVLEGLGMSDALYCGFDDDSWFATLYELRAAIEMGAPFSEIARDLMPRFFGALLAERMLSPSDEAAIKTAAREEWKRLRKEVPDMLTLTGRGLAELVAPTDSVRCMTIHVSKGLEFNAVALVNCEEDSLPWSNYYRPPDVEGGRRLFFVALTRGEQLFHAVFAGKESRYLQQAGIEVRA